MNRLHLFLAPVLLPLLLWAGILWAFLLAARPELPRNRSGVSLLTLLPCLLLLNACTTSPTKAQSDAIVAACAIDAGIRPLVSALLLVPNLAQPDEALAVTAARAVIDPICANPTASVQANTLLVLNQNIGTITGILTTLQTRKTALATPKTGLSLYALYVWPRAWQT